MSVDANAKKLILNQKIRENDNLISIMSVEDLLAEWSTQTGKSLESVNRSSHVNIASSADCPGCHDVTRYPGSGAASGQTTSNGYSTQDKIKFLAGLVSPGMDTRTLTQMVKELGIDGRVVIKKVNGKSYALIKGFAGKRKLLKGTRYLASNPKIVDMAIGQLGRTRAIVSGARLTFALYIPLNILSLVLDDEPTLLKFIGTTATDLVKIGISSLVAAAAASGIAAITTIAAGPFAIAIVVGLITSITLDELDRKYKITDSLIAKMEQITDEMISGFARKWWELENILKWQALNGQPVGQGIFY